MARLEQQFGAVSALGSTYTGIYTVPSGTTANLLLHVVNRTSATVNLRAYVATSAWTSAAGEPTGANLVAAIAYDLSIPANRVYQISGVVLTAGQQLVVWAGAASSLDVLACGVKIS
jgi:hypothetical protein